MSAPIESFGHNKRIMAYTAAAMYGAAGFDGMIENYLPHDPRSPLLPVVACMAVFVVLLAVGRRLPRLALGFVAAGMGVLIIGAALATTPLAGDGAVLYALPVLWTTMFFGRRGAIAIIVWVGIVHAVALVMLPADVSYPGRWVDVMVCTVAIALVVHALEQRNQRLVERLRNEARTDPLTGLLNRRGFDERAEVELGHARRRLAPVALAVFDIDHFKAVNDRHGHEVGDRVLTGLGGLLAELSRDVDVIARFGGEEFVVLMPSTDEAGAQAFAERVREALATRDTGHVPRVRVSAGVCAQACPYELRSLLHGADRAMYEAKRSGRDRTYVRAAA